MIEVRAWVVLLGSGMLAIAAGVAGCFGHSNTLASGQPGAPGVQKFLVCAPNTVISLPAELANGTGPLRREIESYLRVQGRDVEVVDLYESRQLFANALERAKAAGDVDKTRALFAEELARTHTFDAVVMPSILLHKTRVTDSSGRWDGVSRRMRMVNAPPVPIGRGQNTFADGIRAGGINGEVPVTSVHVLVLTRAGERVFEGRGGIEFVQEMDMSPVKSRYQFNLQMRSDLFHDLDALREGIEQAFDPYLIPPE
jgi:hypothetical protein